jgi:hypothetical protein
MPPLECYHHLGPARRIGGSQMLAGPAPGPQSRGQRKVLVAASSSPAGFSSAL